LRSLAYLRVGFGERVIEVERMRSLHALAALPSPSRGGVRGGGQRQRLDLGVRPSAALSPALPRKRGGDAVDWRPKPGSDNHFAQRGLT
jgi:hypothetical protein